METNKVISTDKATVIIQVNPQVTQNTVIHDDGQEDDSTTLTAFFKGQPKALGTVQIMTGLVFFIFGILRTSKALTYPPEIISVISGITYWGSLFYIAAGSLSVAAQDKLHQSVVKASLVMNVISAITAGMAIVLISIEIGLISGQRSYYSYGCTGIVCIHILTYDLGISGVMLAFNILQFIISICISGFACKATCNRDSTVVNVALNQGY